MSYELLSETTPKARKDYVCIWCGGKIKKGTLHVHECSKFDGDFQDHRWHSECWKASTKYFRDNAGESEFIPYVYKRGSIEEK